MDLRSSIACIIFICLSSIWTSFLFRRLQKTINERSFYFKTSVKLSDDLCIYQLLFTYSEQRSSNLHFNSGVMSLWLRHIVVIFLWLVLSSGLNSSSFICFRIPGLWRISIIFVELSSEAFQHCHIYEGLRKRKNLKPQ